MRNARKNLSNKKEENPTPNNFSFESLYNGIVSQFLENSFQYNELLP